MDYEGLLFCTFSVVNDDSRRSDCLPLGSNACRTCLVLLHFCEGSFVGISYGKQEILRNFHSYLLLIAGFA